MNRTGCLATGETGGIKLTDKITRLDELLSKIRGNHVYIQTHNFPDPDAISSAFGLQKILEYKGISSTIIYQGRIDKYSTRNMCDRLDINIHHLDSIGALNSAEELILVDAQACNPNIKSTIMSVTMCIDHHPTYEPFTYKFSDIRPWVGACASIIAAYYFINHIEMDKNVATALLYGIKVDTANLSRGVSELDLNMFYLLFAKADNDLINSLESSTVEFDDLSAYANAIKSIKVYDNISFANTGNHCPEPLVAAISDFMMSIAGVNLSVVYSIKMDGIKISVRSDHGGLDAGQLTNEALDGIGGGGGHPSMAGGFVPFKEGHGKVDALIEEIENAFINTVMQHERIHNVRKM